MRISDRAIVLQAIRRGDNQFIVKLFTRQNGLVTAAARVGKSATSGVKVAHIQPLSDIRIQLLVKQNREIQQLTEAFCENNRNGISTSMHKLGIAQFMNELLLKSMREQQPNAHLFEFVETCLNYLGDSEDGYINLHLYFLVELTRYLGFEPQNNYSNTNCYFDCRNGNFSPVVLAFPLGLSADESVLFSQFLKINPLHTSFSNQQRRQLLEIMVAYYRFHIPGFTDVRSLEVLKEVMGA